MQRNFLNCETIFGNFFPHLENPYYLVLLKMTEQATFAPPNNVESKTRRFAPLLDTGSHIAVIGAGAFGGWTALWLLRNGFKVTLIDAWGAGNSRSSSGDETRVSRSTYGTNETYFVLSSYGKRTKRVGINHSFLMPAYYGFAMRKAQK